MAMIDDIKKTHASTRWTKSIETFKARPGQGPHRPRAPRPARPPAGRLLRHDVPLSQVANVTLLDARTISVQPWEKKHGAPDREGDPRVATSA